MLHSYNARFISLLFGEPTSHLSTVDTVLKLSFPAFEASTMGSVAPAVHTEGGGDNKCPIFYYFVVLMAGQRVHVCCSNAGIQRSQQGACLVFFHFEDFYVRAPNTTTHDTV